VSDFEPVRIALAGGIEGLKERLRTPGVAVYWSYSEQDEVRRFWSGGPPIAIAGLSAVARAGSAPELPPARVREVVLTGELPPDDAPSVAVVPIRMGGIVPAVAWVEIPAPPAGGTAGQAFLYVALGSMALVLGFLFFYMNQRVSQPLRSLIGAMGRGTEGTLEPIAEGAGSGEVSWLAGSFNRLVGKLKASDNQNRELLSRIQRFNEELKVKIAQATRELERRNEELRKSNDRLFTLQRELSQHERLATLGQLAGNMAHELGTPLNAMSGHVELMLSEEEALNPDVAKRLKLIGGQIDRLSTIIQQTLHQLRAPAPRFASVDLNALVSGIATLVQPTVGNRQIALRSSLAPSLPPVAGDPEQLEQVLMNLVNNAVDAMPSGGSLDLITALSEGHVVLQVRDTGAGIPPEDIGRVFEPFYSTKKAGRGTGLGLAICRSIVKSHNGTIEVSSEPGKGAWFTVKLPAAEKLAGGPASASPVPVPSR
jgi:signal transduction histidine kinase